jgi:glycosyltransferase involved in cell wall biosynthesis
MPKSSRTGETGLLELVSKKSARRPSAATTGPGTAPAASSPPQARREGRRPLRILQISHDLKPGGLQRVVLDLAVGLNAMGHEAHVCSLRGPGPLLAELADREVPTFALPWPEKGPDRLLFLKVLRLLRVQHYDVVHTHNTQAFLDGGLAAALARVPARVHTDHARPFPDKLRYMVMERVAALAYHKVVGVSQHTAENLRRYEKIAERRLAVIPNGIDGARYRAARDQADVGALRRQAGLEGFSRVFGLGVRLEEQKGVGNLIDAMPEILARHPDAGLAIAGGGSLEGALKARVRSLGIEDNVRFLGSFANLESFYPLIDFFVLPSLWEGLPLCLLEAMSLGLPIVATAVGGVGELLGNGRPARLVPPGDPGALARSVVAVLDDFHAAHFMGREARRLFDARYDVSVMVRGYLDLYESALGGARAPGDGRG